MPQRIMIVTILRDGSISGMAMRFLALWKYLDSHHSGQQVRLFSNRSLVERLLGKDYRSTRVIAFEDRGGAYLLRRVWSACLFLWSVVIHRIESVHLVAGGVDFMPLLPLLKLLRVKVCMTFATAGLEVGAQGNHLKRLESNLRQAPNVEILNPKAKIPDFAHKRFYSPCSFPYILALGKTVSPQAPAERRNWIVFAGTFAIHKNPQLALDAFAELLQEDHPADLELRFFGKGPLEGALRNQAERVNALAGRQAVRFEHEDELFAQLAVSRIFLSLQEPDNYPSQSLMEAMLYENAVVATDVGETRRIVPAQGNALIPVSVAALRKALAELLSGPVCLPENAAFIRREHSPERFADYFLEVHRNLQ